MSPERGMAVTIASWVAPRRSPDRVRQRVVDPRNMRITRRILAASEIAKSRRHERLHAVNEPCNGLNVVGQRHPPLAETGARQILSRHQSWALVAKIMIQVRFEA